MVLLGISVDRDDPELPVALNFLVRTPDGPKRVAIWLDFGEAEHLTAALVLAQRDLGEAARDLPKGTIDDVVAWAQRQHVAARPSELN